MTIDRPGRPVWIGSLGAAVLSVAFSWREQSRLPVGGLDNSWMFALTRFFVQNAKWGSEVAFTYGPLGFLVVPMGTSPRTFALQLVIRGLVAAWVFLGVRSLFELAGFRFSFLSVITSIFLCAAVPATPELLFCAILLRLACMRWTARNADLRRVGATAFACSFLVLVKFNLGFAAGVLLIVSLVGLAAEGNMRLRSGLMSLAVFLLGLPVWWILARQRLRDLAPFARQSWEIGYGFAANMTFIEPDHRWSTFIIVLCPPIAIGGLIFSQKIGRREKSVFATELVLLGIVGFFAMRSAMIRQDPAHTFLIAGILAFASLCTLPMSSTERGSTAESHGVTRIHLRKLSPIGMLIVGALALQGTSVISVVDPSLSLRSLAVDFSFLSDRAFRAHRVEQSRAQLLLEAEPALKLLERNASESPADSVDFLPHDANYASVANRPWSPPPIFQRYKAYTPRLDRENAFFYASSSAADFLVSRTDAAIDYRSPLLESPRTLKSVFCHYRTVDRVDGWVLSKRDNNRACLETTASQPGKTCVVLLELRPPHRGVLRHALDFFWHPKVLMSEGPDSRPTRVTEASFGVQVIVGGTIPGLTIGGVSLPVVETGSRYLCVAE